MFLKYLCIDLYIGYHFRNLTVSLYVDDDDDDDVDDDDDDDDDDDNDELFLWHGWTTKGVWLSFPVGTIVGDPYHHKSPTRSKQDLNLCRTWVQALLNEIVQWL